MRRNIFSSPPPGPVDPTLIEYSLTGALVLVVLIGAVQIILRLS
jgi:hypothetical protein